MLPKLATAVVYLNKSVGSDVRPMQVENVELKSVTAVLYPNKSAGSDVRPVQP